jgi:chromosome segregation ATPase
MTTFLRRTSVVTLVCVTVAVVSFASARAEQPGMPSNDVLRALLQEVHGLRLAMEHSAAVAPRIQLTLARLNIEEQRITQLAAQFDRARQELTNLGVGLRRFADDLEEREKQLQTTADEKARTKLESDIRELKAQLKAFTASEQAARTRENDAAQALTTEQNRWTELNTRLDELERQIAPVR